MPVTFLCMGTYGILRRCSDWIGMTRAAPDCAVIDGQVCNARFLWLFNSFERHAQVCVCSCRVPGVLASGNTAPGLLKSNLSKVLMLQQQILFHCQLSFDRLLLVLKLSRNMLNPKPAQHTCKMATPGTSSSASAAVVA